MVSRVPMSARIFFAAAFAILLATLAISVLVQRQINDAPLVRAEIESTGAAMLDSVRRIKGSAQSALAELASDVEGMGVDPHDRTLASLNTLESRIAKQSAELERIIASMRPFSIGRFGDFRSRSA
jgi:hypothetical protein